MGSSAGLGGSVVKKPVLPPAPPRAAGFGPVPVAVNGGPSPVPVPGAPAQGGGMYGIGLPPAPAAAAPAPLTNTTQVNPDMAGFLDQYKQKLNQNLAGPSTDPNLQTQVDRLGQRLSADTTGHAIDRASGAIRDQASGQQAALRTNLARRGVDGGAGDKLSQNIDARSQRAQAGAASDISLGRERDLDALTLGGQGIMAAPGQFTLNKNAMDLGQIAGGIGAANTPAQLALGQAGQGLQQWQAQQNASGSAQDRAFAQWMAMQNMLKNQAVPAY